MIGKKAPKNICPPICVYLLQCENMLLPQRVASQYVKRSIYESNRHITEVPANYSFTPKLGNLHGLDFKRSSNII